VLFFGTPHSGSDLASWGELLRRIAGAFKVTSSPLLAALNVQSGDDGQLEKLRDDFAKMLGPRKEGKLEVQNFRETAPLSEAIPSLNPASNLVCVIRGLATPPTAKLTLLKVVPLSSSHIASEWVENLTVDRADHLSICKFGGFDDETYKSFKSALARFLKDISEGPVAELNHQSTQLR
jgi:hypothetical protein